VVLTTNGGLIGTIKENLSPIIDHVNISRHHYDEKINQEIFGTENIITDKYLIAFIDDLNKQAIDVTLNCVLTEKMATKKSILDYIQFAKNVGASAVTFRKQHGSLRPSSQEELFNEFAVIDLNSCPVCRTKTQLIKGIKIIWKCSVSEPSEKINKIYELICHPDLLVSRDWKGDKSVNVLVVEEKTYTNSEPYRATCSSAGGNIFC